MHSEAAYLVKSLMKNSLRFLLLLLPLLLLPPPPLESRR